MTPNPTTRGSLPTYREASSLRSPRDSDAAARQWIRGRQASVSLNSLAHNVALLQRTVDRLARRVSGGGDTITVTICDPSTGTEKTLEITGTEV